MKYFTAGLASAVLLSMSVGFASASDLHRGLPSNVSPEKSALYDLRRVNGGLLAVGELGLVMRSDDAGRTWTSQYAPTDRTLVSIEAISDKLLLAVGHGGTVVQSKDGGLNWQKIEIEEAGQDSFLGITRLKSGRILAYGAYGMYFMSDDNGVTWSRSSVFNEDFDWHISGIAELGDRLYLTGEAGTLGVSYDQGESWSALESPYEGSFFGVLSLEDTLLVYGMRGHVYRSTDQGESWSAVPLDTTSALNSGTVTEDGKVVLTGDNGLIAISDNGGLTFDIQSTPTSNPIGKALYASDGALVYIGYMATGRLAPNEKAGLN